jgi:hypothetical protein
VSSTHSAALSPTKQLPLNARKGTWFHAGNKIALAFAAIDLLLRASLVWPLRRLGECQECDSK